MYSVHDERANINRTHTTLVRSFGLARDSFVDEASCDNTRRAAHVSQNAAADASRRCSLFSCHTAADADGCGFSVTSSNLTTNRHTGAVRFFLYNQIVVIICYLHTNTKFGRQFSWLCSSTHTYTDKRCSHGFPRVPDVMTIQSARSSSNKINSIIELR